VSACINDVPSWMKYNRLQLNTTKTDVLWCAHHQTQNAPLLVGSDAVERPRSFRDLGIFIDEGVTMSTHVSKIVASWFAALRRIRSIQRSVSKPVLSRLDYGRATLAGIPNDLLDRLQSVLSAAARLICRARRYDRASSLLQQLQCTGCLFLNASTTTGCTSVSMSAQHSS